MMSNQADIHPLRRWLIALRNQGHIDALDEHFARLLLEQGGCVATVVAAAITSSDLAQGHSGVPLTRLASVTDEAGLGLPVGIDGWRGAMQASSLLGEQQPLVLEHDFVYLNRYWQYERFVAARMGVGPMADVPMPAEVAKGLATLFGADGVGSSSEASGEPDWQQVAIAQACRQQLLIISGGPGTGKTTTVTRLLALLQQLRLDAGERPLSIALVAPTGKAAARLTESIGQARGKLLVNAEVRDAIPVQASTIHRLLGVIPGSNQFRHHADNPLPLDLLVVDEASMIDLSLMARLLMALPVSARLVLLGDRDQLASVEAGAVLGDLCSFMQAGISPELADYLSAATGHDLNTYTKAEAPGIADNLVMLRKSYRFNARSGIGQLANAVNQGQSAQAAAQFERGFEDISWLLLDSQSYQQAVNDSVAAYSHYLQALAEGQPMERVFEQFHRFQLLVAVREGPFGVSGLNQLLQRSLHQHGLLSESSGWCHGLPIMIAANDHEQKLYNGDLGIMQQEPDGRLMVVMETAEGLVRMLPSRLPDHQSVFAMTVHKSQGSEFERVLMLLPPQGQGVVTRELLYTGITRAKKHFSLLSDAVSFERACQLRTARRSGLALRF